MQPFEKIKEYSKTVCGQIRWKKAHPVITEEIGNHLIDQMNAYIAEGADEAAATDDAIAQMGDPVIIGTQLDRTHRPKPQWSMIILTAALLIIGFVIRIYIFHNTGQWAPSLIYSFAGFALMIAAYFTDFTLIGKYPKTVYFSILALSAAALLFSPVINGGSFYTSFLPLLFPLGFAAIVYHARNKGYWGIILCGIAFLLPACITLLIPSASCFLLFAVSGLVILCTAISKGWFGVKKLKGYLLVFIPVFIVLLLVAAYILQDSYRFERLRVAFDPSIAPQGAGFIGTQIKSLLYASKLFGLGDMSAAVHWSVNDIDYLLTYLTFSLGWIAFIIVMGLLLFFIIKGFMLCFKQKSGLALFVSISVIITLSMQVISYVVANLGLQLIAPISLPLISYGNIATIINLILIGIMLSVFRIGDIVRDRNFSKLRNMSHISFTDGKFIISLNKK